MRPCLVTATLAGVVASRQREVSWAERAESALADAGYRRGAARRAILELLGEQACALTADELERHLSGGGRTVSRATVYRVMEELEEIGLVQRVDVGAGPARYEPAGGDASHHHHLVCDSCGRVEPFTDAGLERAIARVSETIPLTVSEHEIVLRGACERCAPRAA